MSSKTTTLKRKNCSDVKNRSVEPNQIPSQTSSRKYQSTNHLVPTGCCYKSHYSHTGALCKPKEIKQSSCSLSSRLPVRESMISNVNSYYQNKAPSQSQFTKKQRCQDNIQKSFIEPSKNSYRTGTCKHLEIDRDPYKSSYRTQNSSNSRLVRPYSSKVYSSPNSNVNVCYASESFRPLSSKGYSSSSSARSVPVGNSSHGRHDYKPHEIKSRKSTTVQPSENLIRKPSRLPTYSGKDQTSKHRNYNLQDHPPTTNISSHESRTSKTNRLSKPVSFRLLPPPKDSILDNRYDFLNQHCMKCHQNGPKSRVSNRQEYINDNIDWKTKSSKNISNASIKAVPSTSRFVPLKIPRNFERRSDVSKTPSLSQKYNGRGQQHMNNAFNYIPESQNTGRYFDYNSRCEYQQIVPNIEVESPPNFEDGLDSSYCLQIQSSPVPNMYFDDYNILSTSPGYNSFHFSQSPGVNAIENEELIFMTDEDTPCTDDINMKSRYYKKDADQCASETQSFQSYRYEIEENNSLNRTSPKMVNKCHQIGFRTDYPELDRVQRNNDQNYSYTLPSTSAQYEKSEQDPSNLSICKNPISDNETSESTFLPSEYLKILLIQNILTPIYEKCKSKLSSLSSFTPSKFLPFFSNSPDTTADNELNDSPPLDYFYVDDLENYQQVLGQKKQRAPSPRPCSYFGPVNRVQRAPSLSPVIDPVRTPEKLQPFEGFLPNLPSSGICDTVNANQDDRIRFEWSPKRKIQPNNSEMTPGDNKSVNCCQRRKCGDVVRKINFDENECTPTETVPSSISQLKSRGKGCSQREILDNTGTTEQDLNPFFSEGQSLTTNTFRNPELLYKQRLPSVCPIPEEFEEIMDLSESESVVSQNNLIPSNINNDNPDSTSEYDCGFEFTDTSNLIDESSNILKDITSSWGDSTQRILINGVEARKCNQNFNLRTTGSVQIPPSFNSFGCQEVQELADESFPCLDENTEILFTDILQNEYTDTPPIYEQFEYETRNNFDGKRIYDESPILYDDNYENMEILSTQNTPKSCSAQKSQYSPITPQKCSPSSYQNSTRSSQNYNLNDYTPPVDLIYVDELDNSCKSTTPICGQNTSNQNVKKNYVWSTQRHRNSINPNIPKRIIQNNCRRRLINDKVVRKLNFDRDMNESITTTPRFRQNKNNKNFKVNAIPRKLLFGSTAEKGLTQSLCESECIQQKSELAYQKPLITPFYDDFEYMEIDSDTSLVCNESFPSYETPLSNECSSQTSSTPCGRNTANDNIRTSYVQSPQRYQSTIIPDMIPKRIVQNNCRQRLINDNVVRKINFDREMNESITTIPQCRQNAINQNYNVNDIPRKLILESNSSAKRNFIQPLLESELVYQKQLPQLITPFYDDFGDMEIDSNSSLVCNESFPSYETQISNECSSQKSPITCGRNTGNSNIRTNYVRSPQRNQNTITTNMIPKKNVQNDWRQRLKNNRVIRKINFDADMNEPITSTPRCLQNTINKNYQVNVIPRKLVFKSITPPERRFSQRESELACPEVFPVGENFQYMEIVSDTSLVYNESFPAYETQGSPPVFVTSEYSPSSEYYLSKESFPYLDESVCPNSNNSNNQVIQQFPLEEKTNQTIPDSYLNELSNPPSEMSNSSYSSDFSEFSTSTNNGKGVLVICSCVDLPPMPYKIPCKPKLARQAPQLNSVPDSSMTAPCNPQLVNETQQLNSKLDSGKTSSCKPKLVKEIQQLNSKLDSTMNPPCKSNLVTEIQQLNSTSNSPTTPPCYKYETPDVFDENYMFDESLISTDNNNFIRNFEYMDSPPVPPQYMSRAQFCPNLTPIEERYQSYQNTPPTFSPFSYRSSNITQNNELSDSPPLEYIYVDDLDNLRQVLGQRTRRALSPRPCSYFGPVNRIQRAPGLSPIANPVRTPKKFQPSEGLLPNLPSSGICNIANKNYDDRIRFESSPRQITKPTYAESTPKASNRKIGQPCCKNRQLVRKIDFDRMVNTPIETPKSSRNIGRQNFNPKILEFSSNSSDENYTPNTQPSVFKDTEENSMQLCLQYNDNLYTIQDMGTISNITFLTDEEFPYNYYYSMPSNELGEYNSSNLDDVQEQLFISSAYIIDDVSIPSNGYRSLNTDQTPNFTNNSHSNRSLEFCSSNCKYRTSNTPNIDDESYPPDLENSSDENTT